MLQFKFNNFILSHFPIFTQNAWKLNSLIKSEQFYWLRTDLEGWILSTNKAFRAHFPKITHGGECIDPIDRDKIPDKSACEKSPLRPLDVELLLINGNKSIWFISSHDSLIVDCLGLPIVTNPAQTDFFLNHSVLGYVMSIKGLISLMGRDSTEHLTDQICSRLELAVNRLEQAVRECNR